MSFFRFFWTFALIVACEFSLASVNFQSFSTKTDKCLEGSNNKGIPSCRDSLILSTANRVESSVLNEFINDK